MLGVGNFKVINLIIPNISDFPQRLQAQPCNNNQHKVGSWPDGPPCKRAALNGGIRLTSHWDQCCETAHRHFQRRWTTTRSSPSPGSGASLCYPWHTQVCEPLLEFLQNSWKTLSTTGTLTSLLTKPWQPDFFRSVDQLVRQRNIEWIIEDGSALVNIGKDAEPGSTLKSV